MSTDTTATVKERIKEILERHLKWLRDEPEGERADLSGADLSWADLRGADLRGADLSWADLRGADLRGAYLSGAYLSGANLSGANLRGADGIFLTGPHGSRGDFLYSIQHETGLMFKAGCWWGNLADLKVKVKATHGDSLHGKEYAAAIACHVAMAKARKWKIATRVAKPKASKA